MSKSVYKLDVGKLKKDTEPTSAISFMAYEIENANNHNLNKMAIKEQLDRSAERACSLLILNMLIVTLILLLE